TEVTQHVAAAERVGDAEEQSGSGDQPPQRFEQHDVQHQRRGHQPEGFPVDGGWCVRFGLTGGTLSVVGRFVVGRLGAGRLGGGCAAEVLHDEQRAQHQQQGAHHVRKELRTEEGPVVGDVHGRRADEHDDGDDRHGSRDDQLTAGFPAAHRRPWSRCGRHASPSSLLISVMRAVSFSTNRSNGSPVRKVSCHSWVSRVSCHWRVPCTCSRTSSSAARWSSDNPGGATTPRQLASSTSTFCWRKVGMSMPSTGSAAERPSARTSPLSIWAANSSYPETPTSTLPLSRPATASPPPAYGM